MDPHALIPRLLAALLLFFIPASHATGPEAEVPFNPRASLTLDFDSPAWTPSGLIPELRKMGSGLTVMGMEMSEAAQSSTRIYLMRDQEALYIGFECMDDAPAHLVVPEKDESRWPQGDGLEIYLTTGKEGADHYHHFAFNIAGSRAESLRRAYAPAREWEVLTKTNAKGWRAAVRIPYPLLGIEANTSMLRGLFFRDYHPHRKDQGENERTTWGGAPLHDPTSFGELRFTGPAPH